MLLGQHGRGDHHGDLPAIDHRLERRADGDLRLAETHVAADQPVHGPRGLHVGLGVVDRAGLVASFLVGKRVLELFLPRPVGSEGQAGVRLAHGLDLEQLGGVVVDRLLGCLLGVAPLAVAEVAQPGSLFAKPDVARDEERLFQRHVELRLLGEFEDHHLLGGSLAAGRARQRNRPGLQPLVAGQPMFEVHDEFTLGQLGEVDLRAADRLPAPGPVGHRTGAPFGARPVPQDFTGEEHRQPRGGIDEPNFADAGAQNMGLRILRKIRQNILDQRDLRIPFEVDHHAVALLIPASDLATDLAHERVAQRRCFEAPTSRRERRRKESILEIFHRAGVRRHAGFTQPDVAVHLLGVHGNDHVFGLQIAAQGKRLGFRNPQQERTPVEHADGSLPVHVELADRFNLVVEPLQPHGQRLLPRVNIHDPAAHGVLPPLGDLRHVLVAGLGQRTHEAVPIRARARFETQGGASEHLGRGDLLVEGLAGDDDDRAGRLRGEALQHPEPLGGNFRVRHRAFHHRDFQVREHEHVGQPGGEFGGKTLLGAFGLADHPEVPGLAAPVRGERGDEEGTRRFRHVRERQGTLDTRDAVELVALRQCFEGGCKQGLVRVVHGRASGKEPAAHGRFARRGTGGRAFRDERRSRRVAGAAARRFTGCSTRA